MFCIIFLSCGCMDSRSLSKKEPITRTMKGQPENVVEDSSFLFLQSSSPKSCSLLNCLDDDALRAILVRTFASDHNPLRQTCKRICGILNSLAFRKERAELGYAEVRCGVPSPFEQYKEDQNDDEASIHSDDTEFQMKFNEKFGPIGDFGAMELNRFQVTVDEIPVEMKRFTVHMIQRQKPFFSMCDDISDALQHLAVTCFTNRGKIRLASLKKAVPTNDTRPLLFISDFELPIEYRSPASTVGPKILRYLLNESTLDNWSIAMYIPHYRAQLMEGDAMKEREDSQSEEEKKKRKEWKIRLNDQDMRQFFRAGFHQIRDPSVIAESPVDYVYAVPTINATTPILSELEANAIEIAKPTPDPQIKSPEAKKFFALVIRNGKERRKTFGLAQSFRLPLPLIPAFQEYSNYELEKRRSELRGMQDALLCAQRLQRPQAEELSQMVTELQSSIEEAESALSEGLQRRANKILAELDEKLREQVADFELEVRDFLKTASYNVVIKSDAIHACVYHFMEEYVEILLSCSLDDAQRIRAVNHRDSKGYTPLMVAVTSGALSQADEKRRLDMVNLLLKHGAQKDVTNKLGYTALGEYRKQVRNNREYHITFQFGNEIDVRDRFVQELDTLLIPRTGPSPADETIFEDDMEEDDDDLSLDDDDDDDGW